jgi:hypothetical protein
MDAFEKRTASIFRIEEKMILVSTTQCFFFSIVVSLTLRSRWQTRYVPPKREGDVYQSRRCNICTTVRISSLCKYCAEVREFELRSHRSARYTYIYILVFWLMDSLCGLAVRVPGCRSRGPGFDVWPYQIFWEVVGLERGPLSLMRIIEELLEWKVAVPVYKTEINDRGDSLRWPRDTLSPLKLALTSPTSGGLSVGIVCLRAKAMEFVCLLVLVHDSRWSTPNMDAAHCAEASIIQGVTIMGTTRIYSGGSDRDNQGFCSEEAEDLFPNILRVLLKPPGLKCRTSDSKYYTEFYVRGVCGFPDELLRFVEHLILS